MILHKIKEAINDISTSELNETIDVGGGYSVQPVHEPHCESPREWDKLTTMITMHRRYTIGDKHSYTPSMFSGWEEFRKQLERDYNIVAIQPLYMYDHGMISISTRTFFGRAHHAEWDSGQIGWVFITRKAVKNRMGWKRITKGRKEQLRKWMNQEVEEYDAWQRGECYGFIVKYDGEDVDSCFGYIGDNGFKHMMEFEAFSFIEYHYKQRQKQRTDKLKTLIKNHVPLQVRQLQLQLV